MGFAEGVVWSLLGAVVHTAIDVLRKFGAQKLPPAGASLLAAACQWGVCPVCPLLSAARQPHPRSLHTPGPAGNPVPVPGCCSSLTIDARSLLCFFRALPGGACAHRNIAQT